VNDRARELARHQGELRARIAQQRTALASHSGGLERVLGAAEEGLAGVDWLKAHPEVVGVTVAVVVVISPRRSWRWGRRAFYVWRGWQTVRNSLLGAR